MLRHTTITKLLFFFGNMFLVTHYYFLLIIAPACPGDGCSGGFTDPNTSFSNP
jgi:hypothetical protein